mmetsp:Transcript_17279/g.50206  ORF Transcript_17279/g.50206 Transcript_17279/m.50206 type:complete len:1201 (-) Transcript_17279:90-3692(-)
MGRWDALKPEAGGTKQSISVSSHRESRMHSMSSLTQPSAGVGRTRFPGMGRDTRLDEGRFRLDKKTRNGRYSASTACKRCSVDISAKNSNYPLGLCRMIDETSNLLETARRMGKYAVEKANDQFERSLRQMIDEFSVALFDENETSSSMAAGSASKHELFLAIPPNAKGRAIALPFKYISFIDGMQSREVEDIITLACHFVSRMIRSCEMCRGESGNMSIELSDIDLMLSLVVTSDQIASVLKRQDIADQNQMHTLEELVTLVTLMLRCLKRLLAYFRMQVKAEENAESVVRAVLLPILERTHIFHIASRSSCGQQATLEIFLLAMECTCDLTKQNQHASAMLAPLTLISDSGEEIRVSNPLRSRFLKAIHNLIMNEHDFAFLSQACLCLTQILAGIASVERGKIQCQGGKAKQLSKVAVEFDLCSLLRRIRDMAMQSHSLKYEKDGDSSSLFCHALGLLGSIAKVYPSVTASQWSLFLQEAYEGNSKKQSLLMTFASEKSSNSEENDKERIAALSATKALITVLPLQLWYPLARGQQRSRSGNLFSQVCCALACIMEGIRSLLSQRHRESSSVIVKVIELAATIVSIVPDEAEDLAGLASEVLALIGNMFVELVNGTVSCEVSSAALKAIASSAGGEINQQGQLSPLLAPARDWLCSPESDKFIICMLSLPSNSDVAYRDESDSLLSGVSDTLSSILRMAPFLPTKSAEMMRHFDEAMQEASKSDDNGVRELGAKCLNSLLHGRKEFFLCIRNKERDALLMSATLQPLLFDYLSDSKGAIQCCALSGCGFLRGSEWDYMSSNNSLDALRTILAFCSNKRKRTTNNVRAEACKSIGQICTTCVTTRGEQSQHGDFSSLSDSCVALICEEVSSSMIEAMEDGDASVRSMALFAVGNLALALSERGPDMPVSSHLLLDVCISVQHRLRDKNAKVVGNAIRSLGHLSRILFNESYSRSLPETGANVYKEITASLCGKVEAYVKDASLDSLELTWKQRLYGKKHAKGAAIALSFLLTAKISYCSQAQSSVESLIMCLGKVGTIDDRVALAALGTLTIVPVEVWRLFRGEHNSLTSLLIMLMLVMFHSNEGKKAHSAAINDSLCSLMLRVLSISDRIEVVDCLANEGVTPCMVDAFYKWIVQQDVGVCILSVVSHALQSEALSKKYDVVTTQKFLSRTSFEQKRVSREGCKNDEGDVEDGLEDEL